MQWTYADEADQQHLIDESEFPALIADARISRETLVWNETLTDWKRCIEARPDLFGEKLPTPPALTPSQRKQVHLQTVEAKNSSPPLDGVALCSMIFGIPGILSYIYVLSIPAVVCGHIGLRRANRNPGNSNNKGFSIAGLVTGYLGIVFLLLFLVYFFVIFAIGISGAFDPAVPDESYHGG